ncbi:uracil-DNA glycosylase [Candidatus Methylacidiphilum infernorum]|uniref:Type-5 uracil-DNA glycosylase n=1 Tax=Candidatus Methylacidiphilum infernorum TaxID=511746 RepID=A0ABX7PVD5_9BACT|nr:uracil-DNA glycosylase [Candidatus Methylacidiphilum infernorum]QSR86912.1 uracil-DNA glycosylase [Candidatus Methylacidiphilum infernorum]
MPTPAKELSFLNEKIVACRLCPRLVAWREEILKKKPKRFAAESYWSRPVPGFGDPLAELLIVGLAPAAHGGNRTGRMFTGDRSGDFLFETLHRFGYSSSPKSISREDSLVLNKVYITATVRCAPPKNKPSLEEIAHCRQYLIEELRILKNIRVILALGRIAFDNVWQTVQLIFHSQGKSFACKKPSFSHGIEQNLPDGRVLIGSFHPSQQNTFTGKLTQSMFDSVFSRINTLITIG